jgi:hypothetical protein
MLLLACALRAMAGWLMSEMPLAFGCSRHWAHACGRLSWGVWRPDVRNTIGAGDVVVFVAADRLATASQAGGPRSATVVMSRDLPVSRLAGAKRRW